MEYQDKEWYHGCISRDEAENLLKTRKCHSTFIILPKYFKLIIYIVR